MASNLPDYIELQAGLCKTQMECRPMPPKTSWEWVETYGMTKLDKAKVFDDWENAVNYTTTTLDAILPEEELDRMLEPTRETALTPGKVIFQGSGWGALENLRRSEANLPPLSQHLDFGVPGSEQQDWVELLKNAALPEKQTAPSGYMIQSEWLSLLENVPDTCWQKHFHMGLYYYSILNFSECERQLRKSIRLNRNSTNLYVLSHTFVTQNKLHQAASSIFAATKLDPDNPTLCKDAMKILLKAKQYQKLIRFYRKQSSSIQERPLCRYFYAEALAHTNHIKEAEELLHQDGGLELPDIREGEQSITGLYIKIRQYKLEKSGVSVPSEEISVPFKFDVRMRDHNKTPENRNT